MDVKAMFLPLAFLNLVLWIERGIVFPFYACEIFISSYALTLMLLLEQNILLSGPESDVLLKIADFGLSR